jgi:hypothetical protein
MGNVPSVPGFPSARSARRGPRLRDCTFFVPSPGTCVPGYRQSPLGGLSFDLYPIFGLCRFEAPWSRYDHCVIAWGGVIAQLLVAIPLMAGVELFGYSRFNPVNVALFIFGQYSLVVAVFNLLPVKGLDGAMAWGIIPEAIKRLRARKVKKASAGRWRSY